MSHFADELFVWIWKARTAAGYDLALQGARAWERYAVDYRGSPCASTQTLRSGDATLCCLTVDAPAWLTLRDAQLSYSAEGEPPRRWTAKRRSLAELDIVGADSSWRLEYDDVLTNYRVFTCYAGSEVAFQLRAPHWREVLSRRYWRGVLRTGMRQAGVVRGGPRMAQHLPALLFALVYGYGPGNE